MATQSKQQKYEFLEDYLDYSKLERQENKGKGPRRTWCKKNTPHTYQQKKVEIPWLANGHAIHNPRTDLMKTSFQGKIEATRKKGRPPIALKTNYKI